jgi:hypothetical protein
MRPPIGPNLLALRIADAMVPLKRWIRESNGNCE